MIPLIKTLIKCGVNKENKLLMNFILTKAVAVEDKKVIAQERVGYLCKHDQQIRKGNQKTNQNYLSEGFHKKVSLKNSKIHQVSCCNPNGPRRPRKNYTS